MRALGLALGLVVLAVGPARAQDEPAAQRVSVTAVMIRQGDASTAQATNVSIGVRRGIEEREGLRFADPVDLLSTTSVPEEVQMVADELDPLADTVRNGDAVDAEARADAAVAIFEQSLTAVRRAQLADAYMLQALAQCRQNRRRRCQDGFARVLTFREGAEYDTQRYPSDYAPLFEETRQRVLAGPRGSLEVVTEPEGAEVFIDGRSYGAAPVVAEGLLVGDHYITAKLVGFEKQIARATVEVERQASTSLDLQPIPRALLLERDLERLPAELGEERAGPVISGLSGYLFANQVVIGLVRGAPGDEIDVELYLYDLRTRFLLGTQRDTVPGDSSGAERVQAMATTLYEGVDLTGAVAAPIIAQPGGDPPVYEQWWFWTAIGVVVVSGVVTAVALGSGSDVPGGWTRVDTTY